MKFSRIIKLFLIIFFLFLPLAEAVDSSLPDLQNFITKLENQKNELQGGAIAILYKGQVIYKETFGHQKDKLEPITSSTLFPLGSVSKPVSATAIALLVDNGSLSFEQKFKLAYLKNQVSLANILGHTTGYQFSGNFQIEQGMERQKILAKLKLEKPKCKPGKCYSYSNMNFSLVEEVLNTKNISLEKAIKNLRDMLKIDGIQIVPINAKLKTAYPHEDKKSLPFPPYYPKAAPAAAGIFASIDGMIEVFKLSFGYRPDLISQKTLDYMYNPIIKNYDIRKWNMALPFNLNEIESYYAIGWRILKNKTYPDRELIFHSGYIAGIATFIGFVPSKDIGIIILYNQKSGTALKNGFNFWSEVIK